MPSRPMLTTPARSDQRPPRPASMIGMVAISVAAQGARTRSRSLAPVIDLAAATSAARTEQRR